MHRNLERVSADGGGAIELRQLALRQVLRRVGVRQQRRGRAAEREIAGHVGRRDLELLACAINTEQQFPFELAGLHFVHDLMQIVIVDDGVLGSSRFAFSKLARARSPRDGSALSDCAAATRRKQTSQQIRTSGRNNLRVMKAFTNSSSTLSRTRVVACTCHCAACTLIRGAASIQLITSAGTVS